MCQIILALKEAISKCCQKCIHTFETHGQMYGCGHGWGKIWTSPVFIAWVKTKSGRDQWALRAAEQWGLRCSYYQLTQVCFATCAWCRDGKSAAWLSSSHPPCSAGRCPRGFVSIRGSEFCVWGTVCSMYYKIDLSVNDADLYRGSVCLKREPWGDILHRADNTVISVICVWYFWLRKG